MAYSTAEGGSINWQHSSGGEYLVRQNGSQIIAVVPKAVGKGGPTVDSNHGMLYFRKDEGVRSPWNTVVLRDRVGAHCMAWNPSAKSYQVFTPGPTHAPPGPPPSKAVVPATPGSPKQTGTPYTVADTHGKPLCKFHLIGNCKNGASCQYWHPDKSRPRPDTRIEAAAKAMIVFLRSLMGPRDRCSISAFNQDYHPIVQLEEEDKCVVAMAALTRLIQGSTHLYEAITLSVLQFVKQADKSRPWVLIILTDGTDSDPKGSSKLADTEKALNIFNRESTNFTFIVSVGSDLTDTQVNNMKALAQRTRSLFVPAKDVDVLMAVFALIALQVTGGGTATTVSQIQQQGQATQILQQVQQQQQVTQRSCDLLLLVDVSGSMLCF